MSTNDGKVLYLVDGSALAYRSFFAFIRANMSNGAGLNTGAIYGYTKTLLRILAKENPTHMAVVFDTPEPTFRHKLFEPYKATREKMPDDMREQLPWMKKVTEALSIPLIEKPGFEADDVICTLARQAEEQGFEVMLVTGDKDFMQVVSEKTKLYNIMKAGTDLVIVDREGVIEKFGVGPERVIDVLALMGDSSDNVPGVAGVGEKTAIALVKEFGTVEEILAQMETYSKKSVREKMLKDRDMAILSKQLVTIDTHVELTHAVADLICKEPDPEVIAPVLKELAFESLRAEYMERPPEIEKDYRQVRSGEELRQLISLLREQGTFVVDLETTGLDPLLARIVGFSFSVAEGQGYYVALNLEEPILDAEDDARAIVNALRPILEDPKIKKCGQNIKYDLAVMRSAGINLQGINFDTMLASYVLHPESREHNLDALSLRYFDYTKIKTSELIGKGKDQITMDLIPPEIVGEYACEDADFTYRLQNLFTKELAQDLNDGRRSILENIEIPLISILEQMERHGISLDIQRLKSLSNEIGEKIAQLTDEIHKSAGHDFTINSPKQLGTVLFEELKLHEKLGIKVKKTKTGAYTTNQETLDLFVGEELPARVLEYRGLTKLQSTYVLALPKMVHPTTGRIHSNFNQAVAATGRLSSSNPNLQNIPIRSALGRRVREAFVATAPDWNFVAADYSQVELRIMAHVAQDEGMLDAFRRGADIHRDTAARIFEVDPDSVDGLMRSRAKSINFGIMYGMGAQRLARETGLTVKEAEAFIERYFDTFPAVREYIAQTHEKARQDEFVTTLYGRKRPIPDINSKNGRLRSAAENMAVNTPIQGSAADIIKMAMIAVDGWMKEHEVEGKMVLQVHDELVFDVPPNELDLFLEAIPKLMSGVAELDVPLVVDTGVGKNWSDAH